ncbi:MAG TPA: pyruvate, water dikinase regulatory protein [Candidatus Manganitrophaceae bacterium]|nr:pyruvate, water dikinase regulatory protein [Candidatus Manganitrophaceae bacterium]
MDQVRTDLRPILVVSDATGETGEKISQAALAQFTDTKTIVLRRHNIRTNAQIEEVLQEAKSKRGLIIFTFVSESLRLKMREGALQTGLLAVDLLGPILTAMSHFLNSPPNAEPGRLHRVDTNYFGRVEAVQFTVKHDDGQNLQGVPHADIVLVGPSRTAKTPLSIYLAQFGYKVANIPIILNLPLPKELQKVNPGRVVALVIDSTRLMEIREARLQKLNQRVSGYADIEMINQELNYCREIYRQNPKWGIVDVTGRAVEEVATDVISWVRRSDPIR